MKHLTVDEVIQFVSLTELNSRAIQLSTAVNSHIRRCADCMRLVRAFQMTYDGFQGLAAEGALFHDPAQTGPGRTEIEDFR